MVNFLVKRGKTIKKRLDIPLIASAPSNLKPEKAKTQSPKANRHGGSTRSLRFSPWRIALNIPVHF